MDVASHRALKVNNASNAMKSPKQLQPEVGVYDPSSRRADSASYWQWTNSGLGKQWNEAAECVNLGWPTNSELKDRSARWYGILFTDPCDFWVYRVFAAGKDHFGRDGRYFFVIVRLRSPDDILRPQVAGLFSYFDAERGLPLKTGPLDNGWQDAAPDDILVAISEEIVRGGRFGHWGMDGTREMIRLLDPEPAKKETAQAAPFTGRGKLIIGAGVVASAIGCFVFNKLRCVDMIFHENDTKTTLTPPNPPTNTLKPSDHNFELESDRSATIENVTCEEHINEKKIPSTNKDLNEKNPSLNEN